VIYKKPLSHLTPWSVTRGQKTRPFVLSLPLFMKESMLLKIPLLSRLQHYYLLAVAYIAVTQLMHEYAERERSSYNVIVYGVSESSSLDINTRISDDLTHLSNALSPLSISLPQDIKMVRLRRAVDSFVRPLKLIFNNKDLTAKILSDFRLASSSSHYIFPALCLHRLN